jgi:cytidylate kinase
MTADVGIRAERRYKELTEKGLKADFKEVRNNIISRDNIDENRSESPLKQADDSIVLDNSDMTPEDQMIWFNDLLRNRGYHES